MKVVHVYKDFDPPVHGGMERHMALMCRYQREWGEVEAITCSRTRRTQCVERDGTMVTEVAEWGRFQSAPFAPAFPWHMRRKKPDVWVLHFPCPTAEIGYLLSRPKGALVVRYQSDIVRQARALRFYKPILMQFLRKADMILPTSQQYVEHSPFLSAFAEKCRIVPLGIEVDAFAAYDTEVVESLKQRHGGPFVFFCGRHRYYKGLQYLIEAAPDIRAQIVIAGDGPERPALEQQAAELGVSVMFIGTLSNEELVHHLHAATVVAFPSIERSEAYGIGMLEAHACGTPVVATRLETGVEFVNEDGLTGFNVPPRDARAFADAVNRLLDDSELRQRMGDSARERIRRDFDARELARREWELYREVAG